MATTSDQSSVERRLRDSHWIQINVLESLSQGDDATPPAGTTGVSSASESNAVLSPKYYRINEIADLCGIKDEKEVQRYLFILEGQKLVSPYPEGDFTSKTWYITKTGLKALKTIRARRPA